MSKVTLYLNPHLEERLKDQARAEERSYEAILEEALSCYFGPKDTHRELSGKNPYEPLKKIVGLAKEGPTDSSVLHDLRSLNDE